MRAVNSERMSELTFRESEEKEKTGSPFPGFKAAAAF